MLSNQVNRLQDMDAKNTKEIANTQITQRVKPLTQDKNITWGGGNMIT